MFWKESPATKKKFLQRYQSNQYSGWLVVALPDPFGRGGRKLHGGLTNRIQRQVWVRGRRLKSQQR